LLQFLTEKHTATATLNTILAVGVITGQKYSAFTLKKIICPGKDIRV
jgi:hypothetical protein